MIRTTTFITLAALGAGTASSPAATVGYFKFDEGSGQNAASTGGVADPLLLGFSTSNGGDPDWVAGVDGTGLDFDPSDGAAGNFVAYNQSQGNSATLVQTGDFTIELFFRPDALPVGGNNSQTLISLYNEPGNSTRNYELRIRTTTGAGNPTFLEGLYGNNSGLVGGVPFGSADLVEGETYFAALTYDATADTLTTRIENLNNSLFSFTTVESGVTTLAPAVFDNPAFSIGARTNGGTSYENNFDGLIDEVRISNSIVAEGDLLINVIPEPGSAIAGMVGLGLLGMRRRR